MANKSKRPYSVPSRTIKTNGVKKTTKKSKTENVLKVASDSKIRKNNTSSRTKKNENIKKKEEVKNKKINNVNVKSKEIKNNKNNNTSTKSKEIKKEVPKKKKEKAKKINLDFTTRIRIDKDRINDYETLDTSFLEGRIDKKTNKNKKLKEKILKEKKTNNNELDFGVIKNFIIILLIIIGVGFSVMFFSKSILDGKYSNKDTQENEKVVTKDEEYQEEVIDDNYLFVGDFYTKEFNFDDYDYHYVKVCENDFTTKKVLDDLKNKVYRYNPSIVFIQLGIIDLNENKSVDEIVNNMEEIIDNIKDNRPYTKIYIESLYPINKDADKFDRIISKDILEDDIKEVNKKLKDLTKSKKVEFLDLYSILSDEDKLKDDYSSNGVKLNDEGYSLVREKIEKIINSK